MKELCSVLKTMRTHRPGPQQKSLRAAGQNSADAAGYVPNTYHTELLEGSIPAMALRSGFWEHRGNVRVREDTGWEGKPAGGTVGR